MVIHHPNTDLLTDYAAGSLAFGQSLCVAVHLESCAACRATVAGLDMLGAELVEHMEPVPPTSGLLDQILEQIDQSPVPQARAKIPAPSAGIPRPLAKLIPDGMDAMPWRRVTSSLQSVILGVGDREHQVSLIRMKPGGSIAEHRHAGSELTVVLQGGFSDHTGAYRVGDFVKLGEEDQHQPIAHQNEDCICLAAQDGPIQFTGFWGRMINPFLGVHPQ